MAIKADAYTEAQQDKYDVSSTGSHHKIELTPNQWWSSHVCSVPGMQTATKMQYA